MISLFLESMAFAFFFFGGKMKKDYILYALLFLSIINVFAVGEGNIDGGGGMGHGTRNTTGTAAMTGENNNHP